MVAPAAEEHPAGAEDARPVHLGEAAEGGAQRVLAEGRRRRVLGVAVEDAIVDLVREDRDLLCLGETDEPRDDIARIDCAGGVVRIDDDQRLTPRTNEARDLLGVGDEFRLGTALVVDGFPARDHHRCGPQRVVRRRQEDLVARLEQRLHRHEDQLGDAVAHEHVVGSDADDATRLRVHDDGLACREDPLLMAVAFGLREVLEQREAQRLRRAEAKRGRVADVQLDDIIALALEFLSTPRDRAADLVAHVREVPRRQQMR